MSNKACEVCWGFFVPSSQLKATASVIDHQSRAVFLAYLLNLVNSIWREGSISLLSLSSYMFGLLFNLTRFPEPTTSKACQKWRLNDITLRLCRVIQICSPRLEKRQSERTFCRQYLLLDLFIGPHRRLLSSWKMVRSIPPTDWIFSLSLPDPCSSIVCLPLVHVLLIETGSRQI